MSKKLDVEKVDAALKRAARTAVIGSREARSGRLTVLDKVLPRGSRPEVGGKRRARPASASRFKA